MKGSTGRRGGSEGSTGRRGGSEGKYWEEGR